MPTKSLNKRQMLAVKALSAGATRSEAATKAGCSERTLYEWLKEAAFQSALTEARASYWEAVLSGLKAAALSSVRYLHSVVTAQSQGDALRIKGAGILLSQAITAAKFEEIENLKARLDELEAGENHDH